jgi:hypothetical protein
MALNQESFPLQLLRRKHHIKEIAVFVVIQHYSGSRVHIVTDFIVQIIGFQRNMNALD